MRDRFQRLVFVFGLSIGVFVTVSTGSATEVGEQLGRQPLAPAGDQTEESSLDQHKVLEVDPLDEKAAGNLRGKGLRFRAFDGFKGKLGLNWKPIRLDPTHVSLTKNPGTLTITTQRGSIHGDEKNDVPGGGIQAKNLFLIGHPLAADADFTITLAVKKFNPQFNYQQVALLCYDDDDNYLKWGYEQSWREPGSQNFTLVRESDQIPNHDLILNKSGLNRFWLRVDKRGDSYECAWSADGKEFEVVGERRFGEGATKYIGFLAKNGGNPQATEIEVCIDSFEVRARAQ